MICYECQRSTSGRCGLHSLGGIVYEPHATVPQKGWQCPVCGHVWAPWLPGCGECNRPRVTVTGDPPAAGKGEGG